jgi:hypothetical protein
MDPTFAGLMRRYLASVIEDHRLADPPATGCAAGDSDLEDGSLADHVLDVVTAAFVEPDLAPHVVHVDGAVVDHKPVFRIDPEDPEGKKHVDDEDGKPIKEKGSTHVGPLDCPDCTRGLVSRGRDLVCIKLDRSIELLGCHRGCIVACGQEG